MPGQRNAHGRNRLDPQLHVLQGLPGLVYNGHIVQHRHSVLLQCVVHHRQAGNFQLHLPVRQQLQFFFRETELIADRLRPHQPVSLGFLRQLRSGGNRQLGDLFIQLCQCILQILTPGQIQSRILRLDIAQLSVHAHEPTAEPVGQHEQGLSLFRTAFRSQDHLIASLVQGDHDLLRPAGQQLLLPQILDPLGRIGILGHFDLFVSYCVTFNQLAQQGQLQNAAFGVRLPAKLCRAAYQGQIRPSSFQKIKIGVHVSFLP